MQILKSILPAVFILLVPLQIQAEDTLNNEMTQEFLDILEYEYDNRAFAYLITRRMVNVTSDPEAKEYWDQFLELEKQNLDIYRENAPAFSMNTEPGTWTKFRAFAVSTSLRIAPETIMKKLWENTVAYIPQLERMRQIGPETHREFFDYIVTQETVLADSVEFYLNGDTEKGASVLRDFLRGRNQ